MPRVWSGATLSFYDDFVDLCIYKCKLDPHRGKLPFYSPFNFGVERWDDRLSILYVACRRAKEHLAAPSCSILDGRREFDCLQNECNLASQNEIHFYECKLNGNCLTMNESLAQIFDYPIQTLPYSLFPNAKLNTRNLVVINAVTLQLGVRVLLTLAREYLLGFQLVWNPFTCSPACFLRIATWWLFGGDANN